MTAPQGTDEALPQDTPPEAFKRRKIFLVTHEFAPFLGGVATYVHEIATAAQHLQYNVEVLTVDYRGRGALAGQMDDASLTYPVRRLACGGRLGLAGVSTLALRLWQERKRLDRAALIWLSAGAHMGTILLERAGLWSAPQAVNFFHGSEVSKFTRRPVWRVLASRLYRRKKFFATTSQYVHKLLAESGLCSPGAIIHDAPCACPSAFLLQVARVPPPCGNDSLIVILTVARIHRRKGQLDLARAIGLLPTPLRERVVLRLVGTGDPSYMRQIVDACDRAGVRLEVLGALRADDLAGAYLSCDIFAQTSRALPDSVEGFGISYLEASACGKPIVAYDTGGVAEAVIHGQTGLLVAEGDLEGVARELACLIEDPALRARLGRGGIEHARRFSWDYSARILCEAALAAAN